MNWDNAWVVSKLVMLLVLDIIFTVSLVGWVTFTIGMVAAVMKNPAAGVLCGVAPACAGILTHRWLRSVLTPKVLPEIFAQDEKEE